MMRVQINPFSQYSSGAPVIQALMKTAGRSLSSCMKRQVGGMWNRRGWAAQTLWTWSCSALKTWWRQELGSSRFWKMDSVGGNMSTELHMKEFCELVSLLWPHSLSLSVAPRLSFLLLLLPNISKRVPVRDLGAERLMFWFILILRKPGDFFLPRRSLAQLWVLCSCLLLTFVASASMRLPPLRFQVSNEGVHLMAFTFLPLTFCELQNFKFATQQLKQSTFIFMFSLPLGGGRSTEPIFIFLIHILKKKNFHTPIEKGFFPPSPPLPTPYWSEFGQFSLYSEDLSSGDAGLDPCPLIDSFLLSGKEARCSPLTQP